MEDPPVEALKVLKYSQVNNVGGSFFLTEVASLEFIAAILIIRASSQRFPTTVLRGSTFKIIEKFSARYFCKTFSNKVVGL